MHTFELPIKNVSLNYFWQVSLFLQLYCTLTAQLMILLSMGPIGMELMEI